MLHITKSCSLTSALLFAAAGIAYIAGGSAAANDSGQASSSMRWQSALKETAEALKLANLVFISAEKKLNAQAAALDSMRVDSEDWFSQLSFTLLTAGNPYEFRLLCKQVFNLADTAQSKSDMADTLMAYYDDWEEWDHDTVESLSNIASTTSSPEAQESVRQMLAMLSSYRTVIEPSHTNLVDALARFRPFLAKWKDVSQKYEAKIPDQLASSLFSPSCSIFSGDTWSIFLPAIDEWIASAPLTLKAKLPDTHGEWKTLFLWVMGSVLLLGVGFLLRRRLPRQILSIISASHLNRACLCVFAAIPLLGATWSIEFPDSVVLTRIGVALLAVAAMDLSWSIRAPGSKGASPINPLFCLYFSGVALQILNVNPILLAFAWPVCCAVAAGDLVVRLRKQSDSMGKAMLRLSIAVCIALMLLSAAGYTILSMLTSYLWFVSLLALQFGVFASRILSYLACMSDSKAGTLARAVAVGFGVPLLWFGVVGFAAAWVADQFIDLDALWHLMTIPRQFAGVSFSIPLILGLVFLFFLCKTMLSVIDTLLDKLLTTVESQSSGLLRPIKAVSAYIVWAVYVVIVLQILGVTLTSLTVIAGGLSVGIGFGLQHLVSNFISGILILFGQTIRHGDTIRFDGKMAEVHEINMRHTIVKTRDNAIISIPNSEILSKELVNLTRYDPYIRVEIKFNTAYGIDVGKAIEIMMKAAVEHHKVQKKPPPNVLVSELYDYGFEFTLRIWIHVKDDPYPQSDLRGVILKEFATAGIAKPVPCLFKSLD